MLTILSVARLTSLEPAATSKPNEPNILRTLLVFLLVAVVLRLLGWLLCTAYYFTDHKSYINHATYEQIKRLTLEAKAQNETYWLPLEPESVRGINESPIILVLAIFTPEVFVLIAYIALCWLCFSAYIDSHTREPERSSSMRGTITFRCIVGILVVLQIIFVTLYLADAMTAMTILVELTTIELVFPLVAIVLILYYQCKFSGVPQLRYSEQKTRALTASVVIWSVLRIFQCWNGLYASR